MTNKKLSQEEAFEPPVKQRAMRSSVTKSNKSIHSKESRQTNNKKLRLSINKSDQSKSLEKNMGLHIEFQNTDPQIKVEYGDEMPDLGKKETVTIPAQIH